jgi:hypothetical protein
VCVCVSVFGCFYVGLTVLTYMTRLAVRMVACEWWVRIEVTCVGVLFRSGLGYVKRHVVAWVHPDGAGECGDKAGEKTRYALVKTQDLYSCLT